MSKSTPLKQEAEDHAADLSQDLKAAAKAKAEEHIETMRDTAAGKVSNTANAAKAAASEFDPATFQAEAMRQIADRIDEIGARIRHSDIESVAAQVGSFARRNPVLFIGAAAAAGFAATRFLKARGPEQSAYASDDPWAPRQQREHAPVISEMNKEHRDG